MKTAREKELLDEIEEKIDQGMPAGKALLVVLQNYEGCNTLTFIEKAVRYEEQKTNVG